MAAAKRKEIDTALYTEHTDSSIYRPLLWRVYIVVQRHQFVVLLSIFTFWSQQMFRGVDNIQ